jgi:SAM-dependent methyltransferase
VTANDAPARSRIGHEFFEMNRLGPLRDEMARARHGAVRTWLHRQLRTLFSDFDVNAWLGMYPMTFLRTEEWRSLLGEGAKGRLLDVGAGSGDLTRALAPLFDSVVCTETSRGMTKKLRKMGFETHAIDLATDELPTSGEFDAVTILHVLDRCDAPLTLLSRAISRVKVGGLVVVAIPLPYGPCVYRGARTDLPREFLMPTGLLDEDACARIERVLADHGATVRRVERVPYLCPGDTDVPHYMLDSFVFVAQRAAAPIGARKTFA